MGRFIPLGHCLGSWVVTSQTDARPKRSTRSIAVMTPPTLFPRSRVHSRLGISHGRYLGSMRWAHPAGLHLPLLFIISLLTLMGQRQLKRWGCHFLELSTIPLIRLVILPHNHNANPTRW